MSNRNVTLIALAIIFGPIVFLLLRWLWRDLSVTTRTRILWTAFGIVEVALLIGVWR